MVLREHFFSLQNILSVPETAVAGLYNGY